MRIWSDQTRADTLAIKKVRQLALPDLLSAGEGLLLTGVFQ